MTKLILPQKTEFHQASDPARLITTGEAILIARYACESILTGQPDPVTFDRDDLVQALAILNQIHNTIGGDHGR